MYIHQNPKHYRPALELIEEYLMRAERIGRGAAQTKTAQASVAGQTLGFEQGMALALATHCNYLRCQMYSHWEAVPILATDDLLKPLRKIVDKHEELKGQLPAMPKTTEEREQVKEKTNEFYAWAIEYIENEVALPAELEERETERHRQAVLAGTEEATEADRKWLANLRAEQEAKMQELDDILHGRRPTISAKD